MRGRVLEPWLFPDDQFSELRVREELAWEAKRLMHEAVEMAFRSVVLVARSVRGDFGAAEKKIPSNKAA